MRRVFLAVAVFVLTVLVSEGAIGERKKIDPFRGRWVAREYKANLKAEGLTPDQLCVHSIGQSHIDAAWRWRIAQTHTKVYRTWSQALEHMENYPGFTFSGSAPQYYEWIMEDHPDVFAKIVEMEKLGRWEIVGGQWVEPDGNMPDGESFVRQRLLGQRFYLEHFGHISEVGWMLDSFGYHRNMPQIMARSGAKYMWTSKLTWNDTTIFPFHNFNWRSPDGSEVLTHICFISPLPLYFPYGEIRKYKDTRYLLKPGVELIADYTTLPVTIEEALSDDWVNEIGVFYGLGDGGLGPRKIEVETQQALSNKGYAHFSTGLELFEHIAECKDRLPVWNEEMYLEYHRGVLTTQAWIKRANRMAEVMMNSAETVRSITHVLGVTYPYEPLKKIWKLLLLQHFHDILPGSSIPEVYEDARKDFEIIERSTREITVAGLVELADMIEIKPPSGTDALVVFNTLAWQRSKLARVEIPTGNTYQVTDGSGSEVTSQEIMEDGAKHLLFMAEDMPSMGYKVYFIKLLADGESPSGSGGPSIADSDTAMVLENSHVRVALDKKQGWIMSMVDKASGVELIEGHANKLMAFYDRPSQWSAWNIRPDYLDHPIDIEPASQIRITASGPLFVEALVVRQAKWRGGKTIFEQRIRLVKDDPVVYLDLDSDFHMSDALVKLEFNTTIHSDVVAADGPYLVIERPTHPQTPAEKARWEMPCQKWIDLSDENTGLALLNNGKYGFSLNEDGTGYRLSVIKGARYPRANPGAKDVIHRFQSFPIPTGFTDQGPQHAKMGLLVHEGGWRDAKLWQAGYNFNTPLEVTWTTGHDGPLPSEGSFISLESDSAYIGSVKRAEDDGDLVVRLVEAAGESTSANIQLGLGLQADSASETDLLELNPSSISTSGSNVSIDMGPYQVRTVKISVSK